MKKILLISLMIIFCLSYADNKEKYEKKVAKSDLAIQDPKKSIKPGTWEDRGEIFMDAYECNSKDFLTGMDMATLELTKGKPDKVEGDFRFYGTVKLTLDKNQIVRVDETMPIFPDALDKAAEAYKKSIELTIGLNKKVDKDVVGKLKKIAECYITEAVYGFQDKEYKKASSNLSSALAIKDIPEYQLIDAKTDTNLIYNVGLAFTYVENHLDAIKYFERAKGLNYKNADLYRLLSVSYIKTKDTVNSINVLKYGFEKYPSDEAIIVEMINIFITLNKAEEAIGYLDKGISLNPTNASFYYAKGVLLAQIKKLDEAISTYQKALELKPEYFEACYNLGVIFYNQAVEIQKEAQAIPASKTKEYDAKVEESNQVFLKSIPYFEKANQIDPKDKSTLESLKNIYFKNRNISKDMQEKYEKIKTQLESK